MTCAKKILLIGAAALAGVVCLVVLAAAVLTGTSLGLSAVQWGLERYVPGFKAADMKGSLLNFSARGLEYQAPGVRFSGDIDWNLSFAGLLAGRITLENLTLKDADIALDTAQASAAQTPAEQIATEAATEAAPASAAAPAQAETAAAVAAAAAGPMRLEAPLAFYLKTLDVHNVTADIDGNIVHIGRFATDAAWVKDQVTIEQMALADSSFKAAPVVEPPTVEPLGAVLERTFAAPLMPEIGAIDLPVDIELKHFELTKFTIKGEQKQEQEKTAAADKAKGEAEEQTEKAQKSAEGNATAIAEKTAEAAETQGAVAAASADDAAPAEGEGLTQKAADVAAAPSADSSAASSDASADQVVDRVAFALSARDGRVEVTDLTVRAMNAAVVGKFTVGLDARHEVKLFAVASAELPREAIPTGYAPEPIEVEASAEDRAKFFERLKKAREERKKIVAERRAKRAAANKGGKDAKAAAQPVRVQRTEEERQAAALRFKKKVEAWRSKARGELVKTIPRPPVIVALKVTGEGTLAEGIVLKGETDNIPGVQTATFEIQTQPAVAGLPVKARILAPWVRISGAELNNYVFELDGSVVDYRFASTAQAYYAMGEKMLKSTFSMSGKGSEVAAEIKEITLDSNAGRVEIAGDVDWKSEPRFAVSLQLSDIHTNEIMPETPMTAIGSFVAWGVQKAGAWHAKLQDLTILGELRGESLALTGGIETRGNGVLETPGINFTVGRNTFDVAGLVDVAKTIPELSLKAKIDAPDFSLIDPNLKGSIKGSVNLSGNAELPVMDIDVTARGIDYQGTTLESARLTGRVRSQAAVSGNMALTLTALKTAGAEMKNVTLTVKGSEWRHELALKAQGTPVSVDLKVNGSYQRLLNNWTGTFAALDARTPYGEVALEKPVRIGYFSHAGRVHVGALCLKHPQAHVCMKKDINYDLSGASDTPVSVELDKFDLAFIEKYFPGALAARGIVSAKADYTIPAGMAELPRGKLSVRSKNVTALYRMALEDFKLGLDDVALTVSNMNDSVAADWKVDITDNGDIAGNLRVTDIFGSRRLAGALSMHDLSAALVDSFLAPGDAAEGILYGDLKFGGTLDEPLIYGMTGAKDARLDSTKLPFEMLASDFKLAFDGNNSTLSGELRTPKGGISFSGAADWRTFSESRAVVTVKSDDLRVVLPPEIELDLSTNVRCEASSERIKLDGLISLPWARVSVSSLPPSTVDVSDDVVRTDRPRLKKKDKGESIPIESNLFIRVGDDVRVEAMGLKARLTGELHVIQDKGNLGLSGQITVPNGRFKAYGQDLIVRRGQFQFSGEANNPALDLEAIRNPERTADDVIAGVRVSGTANFPRVAVFSEPEKSETEALSYLLRGEGLDPSGDSDNTMITSALINLGLSQGSQVFESLGDAVGISGLGLETEGVGDSSQLVVSGYVLPGLKVKYGVGIFDSLATLTLRYRIIPRLYVEAVSGVDQALDFLYAFEF